jgi:hypothetical protein
VPPDPAELLQQADMLAARTGATQADYRRAISSAYYAVFHFCLTAVANTICGYASSGSDGYSLVYRSVDHKTLANLCRQLRQTNPQGVAIMPSGGFGLMADFARVTGNLQVQRLLADYDPSRSFTATAASLLVADARQAITWFNSCTEEQQKAFLMMLLFKQRPA